MSRDPGGHSGYRHGRACSLTQDAMALEAPWEDGFNSLQHEAILGLLACSGDEGLEKTAVGRTLPVAALGMPLDPQ